jgi:hypothetical protein
MCERFARQTTARLRGASQGPQPLAAMRRAQLLGYHISLAIRRRSWVVDYWAVADAAQADFVSFATSLVKGAFRIIYTVHFGLTHVSAEQPLRCFSLNKAQPCTAATRTGLKAFGDAQELQVGLLNRTTFVRDI